MGQIAHALLTRPPLKHPKVSPLDLHVLGTPPAFVLSQDQTLVFDSVLNLEVSFKLKTHVRIDCLCFAMTRENHSFAFFLILYRFQGSCRLLKALV